MKRKRTIKIQAESEGQNRKKKRTRNKSRNMYWGSSASALNYATRSRQIVCRQNRQTVAATKLLRTV